MKKNTLCRICATIICLTMLFARQGYYVMAYDGNSKTIIMDNSLGEDASHTYQTNNQESEEADNISSVLTEEETKTAEEIDDESTIPHVENENQNNEGIADGGSKTIFEVKNMFPHGKFWNHVVEGEADWGDRLAEYPYDNRFADSVSNNPCAHHGDGINPSIGEYDCNAFDGELQCRGFASRVSYLIYGGKYNTWEQVNIKDIKAGDVLIYHKFGDTTDINGNDLTLGYGHTVFVVDRNDNDIIVGEANRSDGSGNCNCKISWGRSINIDSMYNTTVYSAPYKLRDYLSEYINSDKVTATEFNARCKIEATSSDGSPSHHKGVPIWSMPYSDKINSEISEQYGKSEKATVKNGTEFRVTRKITNSAGNLWYEIQDDNGNMEYVFCENVLILYETDGKRTVKLFKPAAGKKKVPIRGGYYQEAESYYIENSSGGSLLAVVGETYNDRGNLWYRLSNGYYVYSGNVEHVKDIQFDSGKVFIQAGYEVGNDKAGYLSCSDYIVYDTLDEGKGASFRGKIKLVERTSANNSVATSSDYDSTLDLAGIKSLSKVTVSIYDSYRNIIQQGSIVPTSSDVDLETLSNRFYFENLEPGSYYYCVEADTDSGMIPIIDVNFHIAGEKFEPISFYDDSVNYIIENGVLVGYVGTRTSLVVPDGVVKIGDNCFKDNTSLKYIELPDSLTEIGKSAFCGCISLMGIDIPDGVTSIGEYAFMNCSSLRSAILPYNDDFKIVNHGVFKNCISLYSINIPKKWGFNSNTAWYSDGYAPFYNCSSLEEITFEDGITEIPNAIFQDCTGIKSLDIPDTVTAIKRGAFLNATGLESINLSLNLTSMHEECFKGCESLKSIYIPDSVVEIKQNAFSGCKNLKQAHLSTKLGKLTSGLFENCTALESVNIPKTCCRDIGVSFYSSGPFKGCTDKLKIEFENGITELPNCIFQDYAGLTSFVVPETVTIINQGAFLRTKGLTEIVLPSKLKTLGADCFNGCELLTDVIIPNTVTSIGQKAFSGCKNLKTARLPEKVTKISSYTFYGCENLEEISLPDNVTTLGNYAFSNCYKISTFTMSNKVASIGNYCFDHCDKLKTVVLSNALKSIPTRAFSNCNQLESISIPYNVSTISSKAFINNPNLKSVTIPRNTTNIATDAFSYPLTIYGIAGSYAETYANNNGHTFVNKEVKATGLEVLPENPVVNEYGQLQLGINVTPADFTDEITCLSSDTSVLSVDNTGLLKGLKQGKANVTVTVGDVSKTVEVTVDKYDKEHISEINLDPTKLNLFAGQSENVRIVTDTGSVPDGITITNSNPAVVSYALDQERTLITAKGIEEGSTEITVSFEDIEATAEISVEKKNIEFKDQDGSDIGIAPIGAVYGEVYPTLPVPTKDGRVFAGWYTGLNGSGSRITANSIYEGIDVLYAAWIEDNEELRVFVSDSCEYTGVKICPEVNVYDGALLLVKNKDYTVTYKNNVKVYTLSEGDPGFNSKLAPTIIITGKGNYDSKDVVYFKILPQNIGGEDFSADDITLPASTKPQKIKPVLYWNGKALKQKTDYTCDIYKASDTEFKNPLGLTVTSDEPCIVRFTGTGNYTGTRDISLTFAKDQKLVSSLKIDKVSAASYTGSPITPEPAVRDGGTVLVRGVHYSVTHASNVNPGTGYVIITGIPENGYSGTKRVPFKINTPKGSKAGAYDISPDKDIANRIHVECASTVDYVKGGAKPAVTVTFTDENNSIRTLTEGIDYKLSYKSNTAVTTNASVVITGKGAFKGSRSQGFAINAKNISKVSAYAEDKVYQNKANIYATKITLTDSDGKKLSVKKDYQVDKYTYLNNTEVTVGGNEEIRKAGAEIGKQDILPVGTVIEVTLSAVNGSGYTGTAKPTYRISKASISSARVTIPTQTYTGKPIELDPAAITVSVNGQKLTTSDFEIVGYENNINKGTAKVTIRGKDNYGGYKTQSFKIKAKGFRWWWRNS